MNLVVRRGSLFSAMALNLPGGIFGMAADNGTGIQYPG